MKGKKKMMTNIYIFSRKVHRVLIIMISVIGLLMAMTGMLLKYTFIATKFAFVDLGLVRYLHNNFSPIFSIVFLCMLLTGLIMYLFPLIHKN